MKGIDSLDRWKGAAVALAALVLVVAVAWIAHVSESEVTHGSALSGDGSGPEPGQEITARTMGAPPSIEELDPRKDEAVEADQGPDRRAIPQKCLISTCEAHIHGHVEDPGGHPIEGAVVHFGGGPLHEVDGDALTTDAGGGFTIDVREIPDDHWLHVVARGYKPQQRYTGLGLRYRRRWILERFVLAALETRVVHGRVRDTRDRGLPGWVIEPGEPMPVDSMYGHSLEDWLVGPGRGSDRPWAATSGKDGGFVVTSVPSISTEFVARDPIRGEVLRQGNSTGVLIFTSMQGRDYCVVRGRVRDIQGVPVADAQVGFHGAPGLFGSSDLLSDLEWSPTRTDGQGYFVAEGVPQESTRVSVSCEGFISMDQDCRFGVAEGQNELELTLERGHRLRLALDGVPHASVYVQVLAEDGSVMSGLECSAISASGAGGQWKRFSGLTILGRGVMKCPGSAHLLVPETACRLEIYERQAAQSEDLESFHFTKDAIGERLASRALVTRRDVETELTIHIPR